MPQPSGAGSELSLCGPSDVSHAKGCARKIIKLIIKERGRRRWPEFKEQARDYLAADIFMTTARLAGNAAIDRLPKETLRRARRFLTA